MESRKKYYFVGTLAAVILTAISFNLSNLEAFTQKFNLASLNPEVRMCIDLGIISSQDVKKANLDSPIDCFSLGNLLKRTLQMLGTPAGSNLGEFGRTKIFPGFYSRKNILRGEAVEVFGRLVQYLAHNNKIVLAATKVFTFSDFNSTRIDQLSFGYLKEKGIVRGYKNGKLGSNRPLSRREAFCFIYRLYEQVAKEMTSRYRNRELVFVDIPIDHEFMSIIKTVSKAGGLKYVIMGPSFDGNRILQKRDISDIMKGIYEKINQGEKVNLVFNGKPFLSRIELALICEKLLSGIRPGNSTNYFSYIDVKPGSLEESALRRLQENGIMLGYGDGKLRGEEGVTWYEGFGILAKVLELHGYSQISNEEYIPADKRDFEQFAEILKSKRAKVRSILRRQPSIKK
ncbi:MAG: S-layer homology domain-containing protein [Candidatus Riflebacteria bacterium]|nr:S-layer homology domain-containing protein [Candidatus Riflebacteria bacterium]